MPSLATRGAGTIKSFGFAGAGVPGAPTGVSATNGDSQQSTVSFTAPVSNGGLNITSYTVTSSGGQTVTGSSSPITVTGLTNGTSYTFTVRATNAAGSSLPSSASGSITPQFARVNRVYTTPGSYSYIPTATMNVAVLVVGPGGSGGQLAGASGGGGGGGTGYSNSLSVTGGTSYPITITASGGANTTFGSSLWGATGGVGSTGWQTNGGLGGSGSSYSGNTGNHAYNSFGFPGGAGGLPYNLKSSGGTPVGNINPVPGSGSYFGQAAVPHSGRYGAGGAGGSWYQDSYTTYIVYGGAGGDGYVVILEGPNRSINPWVDAG